MHSETSTTQTRTPRIKTRFPGIYYRDEKHGRRYSFVCRDSSGRQRRQVVDGGLDEAKAAQAALAVRKGRGEKIEPTRLSFEQAATRWLESKSRLRARTRIGYEGALRNHLLPVLGRKLVHEVTEDDIARLIRTLEANGFKPWTIRGQVLTPLSGIFKLAVRKGWRSDNPVKNLETDEKPPLEARAPRILEPDEIRRLLDAMPAKTSRPFRTIAFTGLRLGEALGLKCGDVDFARQVIRVRRQLTQLGELAEPKSASAKREVVMFPDLGRYLREQRLRSPFSTDDDFVFATNAGTPFLWGNVTKRGLREAVAKAKLDQAGELKLHTHDLRHGFASMLIREGADVVFVSRQLGHASPVVTLGTYSHLFDAESQATRMRDALERREQDVDLLQAGGAC